MSESSDDSISEAGQSLISNSLSSQSTDSDYIPSLTPRNRRLYKSRKQRTTKRSRAQPNTGRIGIFHRFGVLRL